MLGNRGNDIAAICVVSLVFSVNFLVSTDRWKKMSFVLRQHTLTKISRLIRRKISNMAVPVNALYFGGSSVKLSLSIERRRARQQRGKIRALSSCFVS